MFWAAVTSRSAAAAMSRSWRRQASCASAGGPAVLADRLDGGAHPRDLRLGREPEDPGRREEGGEHGLQAARRREGDLDGGLGDGGHGSALPDPDHGLETEPDLVARSELGPGSRD